jgi:hypothetical protein
MPSLRLVLILITAVCLAAPILATPEGQGAAKSKGKAGAKAASKEEEEMAAMMKLAAPGPQHEQLKKMAGTWKVSNKSWFQPGEPVVSQGTATSEMILGGRFLRETHKGDFNGMPFEGFGLTGYDNFKKEYVGVWMDNFGTGVMTSHGTMDATGKLLTMYAEYDDPMSGGKKKVKMVTKLESDTRHVFSMYDLGGGKENLQMEITYTR